MTSDADQDEPTCPRGHDVATPAECVGIGRFVCAGCGYEFSWPRTVTRVLTERGLPPPKNSR